MLDALSVSSWERNAAWAAKFAKFIKGTCAYVCDTSQPLPRAYPHAQTTPRSWPSAILSLKQSPTSTPPSRS